MRKCKTCGKTPTDVTFGINRSNKDGLNALCRECKRLRQRRLRAARPDKVREYNARAYAQLRQDDLCRERARLKAAAWYAANRERGLITRRNYYCKNKADVLAQMSAYRLENGNRLRAKKRLRYAANKDQVRSHIREKRTVDPTVYRSWENARRARKALAPGKAASEQIKQRVAYYGHCCAYCGGPYESIDHVIPLSRGGSNWPANLRPACKTCNSSKGVKLLSEWRPT